MVTTGVLLYVLLYVLLRVFCYMFRYMFCCMFCCVFFVICFLCVFCYQSGGRLSARAKNTGPEKSIVGLRNSVLKPVRVVKKKWPKFAKNCQELHKKRVALTVRAAPRARRARPCLQYFNFQKKMKKRKAENFGSLRDFKQK